MNYKKEIFRKNDLIDIISDEEYDINLPKTIELSCKELPGWPSKLPEYETFKFYLSFLKKLFFRKANGDIHIIIPKQKLCACFGIEERVGGIIIPRNDIEQHYSLNILELGIKYSGFEIVKQHFEIHGSELLAYRSQGKYGFISKKGHIHTMPIYDDAGCFNWNLAPVKKDGKYGYIDPDGKEVIPFVYSHADEFNPIGVATVVIDGKKKSISTNGTILPYFISYAFGFNQLGIASVVIDGKMRSLRKDGTLLPFYISSISEFNQLGVASVVIDGKKRNMSINDVYFARGEKIL